MPDENTQNQPPARAPEPEEPTSPYAVLERMGDAFVALDGEDRWLYVNAEAERMLGRSRKEFVGYVVWDLYPEARGTAFEEGLRRARATGAQVAVSDFIPSSGRWVENRIHPLPSGVTCVHFTDVTEQRRTQERAEHLAALASALSGAVTTEEVTAAILAAALSPFAAWVGVVALLSDDGESLRVLDAVGLSEVVHEGWSEFPVTAPVPLADAARRGELVVTLTPAEYTAAFYQRVTEARRGADGAEGAIIAAPLLLAGSVIGSLGLVCPPERILGEDARTFLVTVAGQCALALERARLFDAEREARQRAEREARERGQAQEFAQRLIESSPDCIKTLDLNGVILSMSEGGRRLLEMEGGASLCGTDWLTLWPDEEARAAYRAALGSAVAGGVGRFQGFCLSQKGTPRWWDVVIVPILGADGRPEKLLSATRDITDRRQAEQREKALLASVFQQAPAFMAVLRGPGHVFEMVNPPYLQLVGHRGDHLGRPVAEALPEVVEQGFIGLLDRVYQTGEPFVGTDVPILLQRTPGGPLEQRFLDFTYQPLRDTEGEVTGVLAHGIDLTERKRAEDALRLSEERYRTLVESTDVGFCVIEVLFDRQGRPVDYGFLEANPAFERHTGLVGAVGSTMKELVPDMDGFWFETYGRVALTGEAVRFENHAPAMGRWFDVYALRVGAPEERRVGVLFTDITERKQAEGALRRAAGTAAVLNRVNTALRSSFDPDEIEDAAVAILGGALGVDRCYTVAYHVAENYSVVTSEYRSRPDELPPMAGQRYTLSDYDAVMRDFRLSPEAQVVDDVRLVDGLDAATVARMEGLGMRSYVRVPLFEAGELVGSMAVAMAEDPRAWKPEEVELVKTAAAQVRAVVEAARAHKKLEEAEAKQRRIADALQESMLLSPPAVDAFMGLEVDTHYEAAWDEAQIGGDYGDAFRVDEHRVAVLAGDCTGKGLAAARFVAECEFLCRAFLRENPEDPADALLRLNRMLLKGQQFDARPEGALTTLAVAVIDTCTGEALFAAGGAEPPLVVRAGTGEAEEVEVRGALLGADADARYEAVRVTLCPGDTVFLTTDGTTEARNRKTRQFFGYDGVTEAVRQVALRGDSLSGAAREIVARAKEFAGGVLTDDACVLVARFTGDGGAVRV